MNLTVLPPANYLASSYGPLLKQMGATDVTVVGPATVEVGYGDDVRATNAAALLRDEVYGVELVVRDHSSTRHLPPVTGGGIADILRGVAGLDVQVAKERQPGGATVVNAFTADQSLANALQGLVEPNPASGVRVHVEYTGLEA